jgi:hypothetical protein
VRSSTLAEISAAVEVALIRNSPGGRDLSDELVLLLVLLVFDGYMLFPTAEERKAREPVEPSLPCPTASRAVASGIESGAGRLIAAMGKRSEHM